MTLTLKDGALITTNPNVKVSWSAISNYPLQMAHTAFNAEDHFCMYTFWQNYQPTSMTIPFSSKPGKKTVIVRFLDAVGNLTQIQDSINLHSLIFFPLILKHWVIT
jgi:hypothetical protein